MEHATNFNETIFSKNNANLKYNIKNVNTQSYIYVNPNPSKNTSQLNITPLNNANYITIAGENYYNNIIYLINNLILNKQLCTGLIPSKIISAINECNFLLVIGDNNVSNGNIYSFCALSYFEETINTSYGFEKDNYIYADYVCSHTSVKYAGEKLLNALFDLATLCNVNKISLQPVDDAVKFYEKYGFIYYGHQTFNNKLRVIMNKYIKEQPKDIYPTHSTVYITDTALANIKDEDDELSSFVAQTTQTNQQLINELATFLQTNTDFKENNMNDAIEKITEYFDNYIIITVKNNYSTLGFALISLEFYVNNFSTIIVGIYANTNIIESSKIILDEVENYSKSINAKFVRTFFGEWNIRFYEENGYKFKLKSDQLLYKTISSTLGGKRKQTKKRKYKRKKSKTKNLK